MKLSVAIQMNQIENINFDTDSTIRLAIEADKRGYLLYYYEPKDLEFKQGEVVAKIREFQVKINGEYILSEAKETQLKNMDIILIRQDPPFDMPYLTTTYLLELISDECLIVNNPTEIRNSPEKLFVNRFKEFMPRTVISRNKDTINEFLNEQKKIVLKPLYSFGGNDICAISSFQELAKAYEFLINKYNDMIIAQEFLPEVKFGDKRIILANGEPVGAVLRKPAGNDFRSNMAVGGLAIKTELNKRDLEICRGISSELKRRGLLFVGIDVIGNYLTEINVTSPTGIAAINQLNNEKIEEKIWNEIETKLK